MTKAIIDTYKVLYQDYTELSDPLKIQNSLLEMDCSLASKQFLQGKLAELDSNLELAIRHYFRSIEEGCLYDQDLIEFFQYRNEAFVHDISSLANLAREFRNTKLASRMYSRILELQLTHQIYNRTTLIQGLINKRSYQNYLEIGVFVGQNFLQIKAGNCVGVDLNIKVPKSDILEEYRKLVELDSDTYFTNRVSNDFSNGIDIAFVDGLHTFNQSLKDVLNALANLSEGGVVIMHDCYPKNYAASIDDMEEAKKTEGYNGHWNGDVYKTIIWLRTFRKDLNVSVINCDHGLGVVYVEEPDSVLDFSEQEILDMEYDYLKANAFELLNIKEPSTFFRKLGTYE